MQAENVSHIMKAHFLRSLILTVAGYIVTDKRKEQGNCVKSMHIFAIEHIFKILSWMK